MINQFKTFVLIVALTALLLLAGQLLGGTTGVIIAFAIAIAINTISYWYSDKLVLKMYRAKENHEKRLNSIVHECTHLINIPMPKVYIIDQATPNAFATGRNPKHAAVVCTKGILELLNDEELKGVIAHEVSHIKNRDTLIQTIAATLAGAISYLASMAQWAAIFGGFGGNDRNNGGGIIQLLALIIVVPIAAALLQLALSRSREFIADQTAAKTLHNGLGLANALEKLEHKQISFKGNEATASLFIINPFRKRGIKQVFSTHPSTEERIRRLRSKTF